MVVLLLGWPECMEIRLFRGVSATKSRLRRAVFVFFVRGPGPSEAGRGRLLPERSKTLRPDDAVVVLLEEARVRVLLICS